MKFFLFILLVGFSCAGCNHDKTKDLIPGVYVKKFSNEYYRGNDTLVIAPISKRDNSYSIIKVVSYEKSQNGKWLPGIQHTKEQMTGIYDPGLKQLREQRHGALVSFSLDRTTLIWNADTYRRID